VDFILILVCEIVTGLHRVVAGPLTSCRAAAAARCSHVGAGPTDIEIDLLQFVEYRFEVIGRCAQQNDVAGRPVHVRKPRSVLLPDIADLSEGFGVVEPAGRLIDPHGMEVRDIWEFFRKIGIATNHASAVSHDTHNSTVFPVTDLLRVGLLELAKKIRSHRALLCGHLDLRDEAGPLTCFKLVELGCFWQCVRHRISLSDRKPLYFVP
jgi:hypothetical protein